MQAALVPRRAGVCSGMEMRGFHGEPPRMPLPPRAPLPETRAEIVPVDDLLDAPRRYSRPDHMVVIIRGLPGAGKTYVSRLLKVIAAVFFTNGDYIIMSVCSDVIDG